MRVLACDVGFGTSDILLWDDDRGPENQTHAVVPSATGVVASEIRAATERRLPVVLGLFEHQTGGLDRRLMADYLERFAGGCLPDAEILGAGGHGVWTVTGPVDPRATAVIVTGPDRGRFKGLAPREVEAAPFGDMMLTGCYGLLQGYRARC